MANKMTKKELFYKELSKKGRLFKKRVWTQYK